MKLVQRKNHEITIQELISVFPVTAILGPRQVGKTTLAKKFKPDYIFDLENPRDVIQLDNPQLSLENLKGLIMIDEIQRKPELFPLLRYLVDNNPDQKYLILGSASSNLQQQSGESLAGRIGYLYLSGFSLQEVGEENLQQLWVRGGFPTSFLATSDRASQLWRDNFITTFLERDLVFSDIKIPMSTMYRFWIMVSHFHGQTLNYSELARAFDLSVKTIKRYIGLLESAFMLRILHPWFVNIGKRLVKSPKLYIKDTGLFHSLQGIKTYSDLVSNPKLGASWEGYALEEAINALKLRENEVFFYATHQGVEIDLVWMDKRKLYGCEFKFKDSPTITKSIRQAIQDLDLEHVWIIYPGKSAYQLSEKVSVLPLSHIFEELPTSR
ncbi:MAG: ATP-binding protein [Bacteroidota bacterium]